MASISFLPKTKQMIAGSKPYWLGNILALAVRRYSGPGDRPKINRNDPKTHGQPTASHGGKLKEKSEVLSSLNVDQGEGDRDLGAKTVESGALFLQVPEHEMMLMNLEKEAGK